MVKTIAQIQKEYYPDCQVVEVVEPDQIQKYLESKTSCTWGSGGRIDEGWMFLCMPSRPHIDSKQIVFIARKKVPENVAVFF